MAAATVMTFNTDADGVVSLPRWSIKTWPVSALITYAYNLPSAASVMALPALQGVNGPVGATRGLAVALGVADGLAEGVADAEPVGTGVGLVVSDGLGVGAAKTGLMNAEPVKRVSESVARVARLARLDRIMLTN